MEDQVMVVIRSGEGHLLLRSVSEDVATTLVAVTSEDTACWQDLVDCWPRYRTPVVPEWADSLESERIERSAALDDLRSHQQSVSDNGGWVFIDLCEKRVVTGGSFGLGGRHVVFAMTDDAGSQESPLSINLAPWWELHEEADLDQLARSREQPVIVPTVERVVLYGRPLLEDLARRMLERVHSPRWASSQAHSKPRARYEFTVELHRDWLMTPRSDLQGRTPRQLLHGAHRWVESVTQAQERRLLAGLEMVALPTSVTGYDHAPMGRQEMVIYFDLCRELIEHGWEWCVQNASDADRPTQQRALAAYLDKVKQEWLQSPFEDGAPPETVIETSRRRVPLASGVPIVGLEAYETKASHIVDCECPICNMMAEGMFGPCFEVFDGHHLELDDEFAFSMCETRDEWEAQRCEFSEFSELDAEATALEESQEESISTAEFKSAWSGQISDDPLPGDPQGHLKLAFLLAELVAALQITGNCQAEIGQLNTLFTQFRHAADDDLPARGRALNEFLEKLGNRFPDLLARVADFQSRIDEHARATIDGDDAIGGTQWYSS